MARQTAAPWNARPSAAGRRGGRRRCDGGDGEAPSASRAARRRLSIRSSDGWLAQRGAHGVEEGPAVLVERVRADGASQAGYERAR